MFANITWKKFFTILAVALGVTACAFAVKYGEDGQVGTGNEISTTMFIMSGLAGLYDLAIIPVLLRKRK